MAATSGAPSKARQGKARADKPLRRRVFYVAGFDPASPRKYHGIFSTEAARQAVLTGASVEVGPLVEYGPIESGWQVRASQDGRAVEIDYRCLRWNDLVRQMWPKEGLGFFLAVWRAFIVYWRRGVLSLPGWTIKVTALAPVVAMSLFILLYGLVVLELCLAGAHLAQARGWPWAALGLPPLLLWLAAVPVWKQLDRWAPVTWLGRGMICVSGASPLPHPAFEERLGQFAQRLVEAAREPGCDEVLVIGHSMGCQQAARAVGQALQLDPGYGRDGPKVSLLTLGQLIPLYSLMTDDETYRRDLKTLAEARQIDWLDITGPSDPGSICDVHPLFGLGFEPPEARPVRQSPRFHAVLSKAAYQSLRRRPLDFHFQYLMATEMAGGYDYFRLTTGPDRLIRAGAA